MTSDRPGDAHVIQVVAVLVDGDRVELGTFADPAEARACAQEHIGLFQRNEESWPLIKERRYLRPEAVVSIDLVEAEEHPRWRGSPGRKALDESAA